MVTKIQTTGLRRDDLTVQQTLFAKLIAARDSGKSVNSIAREAGVSQPTLSNWITGERDSISAATVDKLAVYFGLKLQ